MTETSVFAIIRTGDGFDVDLIGVVPESDLAYRIVGYGWGETQGAFVFLPWRGNGATLLLRRRSASPADEIELARLAATPKYEFLEGDRFRALAERGLIDDDAYATPLGEDAFGTGP